MTIPLLERENNFTTFAFEQLPVFWQTRQEGHFHGVGGLKICYVCFRDSRHQRVIVVVPGRLESYLKYQELAYDLFHAGYDVFILDHRGQGFSDRLLPDRQRGHVEKFTDYVEDLQAFLRNIVLPLSYKQRYALAHSMGGAVLGLLLQKDPTLFNAVVLSAPMLGIKLPVPRWLVDSLLVVTERYPAMRNAYVPGGKAWRPSSFSYNPLTHSQVRYSLTRNFYADTPQIQVGGPTYHWLKESLQAVQSVLNNAAKLETPLLLLQAEQDRIVDNHAQILFGRALAQAGNPCFGGGPYLVIGARHEILFERDKIRADALAAVLNFFAVY